MVSPGRIRQIYDLGVGIVACKECTANAQRTSPGDGLRDRNLTEDRCMRECRSIYEEEDIQHPG